MYSTTDQKAKYERTKHYLTTPATVGDMAELVALLRYHEWRYYVQNDPVLSDYEYDQLYKQLEALEAAYPDAVLPDSPTQRVGSDLAGDLPNVAHLTPMLSLGNSYDAADLTEFDEQIKKFALLGPEADVAYSVEPKYDGGSIALVYENDQLVRGATRGNGAMGEEMTHNARVIRSIPLRAKFSDYGIARAELRGEVLIRKDIFDRVNAARVAGGKSAFANPRNAATGGLRMKDPAEAAQRGLVAFIYQLGYAEDAAGQNALTRFDTHHESVDALAQLGFKVPTTGRRLCRNMREVIDFVTAFEARRDDYGFELDGMVVKVDSREIQERAGYTSHHPRWAIAYKFKAKQATSTLLKVDYQVGKIGSITPVARIEPVELAGVTVANVSLHNEDFIVSKDLRIGDRVLVERAGDVIPYIVKSLPDLRDGSEQPVEWPKFCPINTTDNPVELVREADAAAWRCPVCVCGEQPRMRAIWHVSKHAMDIDGLGEKQLNLFFREGFITDLADIYDLPYDRILALEGFKEKSVDNLRRAIERAKQNPIHRLLHSLSIHHLGRKVSKLIAAEVTNVKELIDWTLEDFVRIKDVGPVVAQNVIDWMTDPLNRALLDKLEANGVNLLQTEEDRPAAVAADAPLSGKTILFTGKLTLMSRKEAQERAATLGARNISAVSSQLDILVVGEKAGSKLKKAQALGTVQVLTEAAFVELVNG